MKKSLNTINNINKWWHCFIEWEDKNGDSCLSVVPWYALFLGITGDTSNFRWRWVPPWRVEVGD